MNLERDDILVFEDDLEYMIIDKVEYNSNKYFALQGIQNGIFTIAKLEKKGDEVGFSTLTDEEHLEVLKLFQQSDAVI